MILHAVDSKTCGSQKYNEGLATRIVCGFRMLPGHYTGECLEVVLGRGELRRGALTIVAEESSG
jgi:hypothetical protein